MTVSALQSTPPFAGHAPDQERPLGGYAALMGLYAGLCGAFSLWLRRSDRQLPDRVELADLLLVTVATHKVSRSIAKARITSTVRAPFTSFQGDAGPGEVDEAARGRGLRRAIGELVICPYCLGLWTSSALLGGLIVAPRATRQMAAAFTALAGADGLQLAYRMAEDR